ncbi:hypothetical protein MWN33_14190 [Starkeya koreensis]|uniref:YXWGXW repeat-containing protein n=1 Tax=Ancylobacter koreensis TaxID=266121 RepID=A0ABT0DPI3_9HYPH|nr:DUF6600 domain-containing protein [Ancylobacter koreensis]MCK0209181.1 hypothetical protein [Ancylobacter koreensis]
MLRFNRPLLVAGLGASLLASVATLPALAQDAPIRLAQAGPQDAAATMDVNLFYDQLGRFGTWVAHPDYDYVFIPANVGPGWRPYQEGRWVWTEQYGWYWESYEPFGWATYHYGRWGYDPAYGWFWVPGDTWAPAWVTWRRGGGRTGWAPVAPDRPGFAVGQPQYYAPPVAESWVFVEDRYMAEEDIAIHVAPIPQINVYLAAAPDIYEPRWDNGYYVNRGFGYSVYDAPVRERLVTREVYYVDRRDDVFFDGRGGRLGIYAPRLDFGGRLGPPPRYVRDIEPDRRPLIRQYVREERDVPGLLAPSVALLNVLDPNGRRDLREHRFEDPDRYRRQVRELERDRADRLREERRQADARSDVFQRQQREAIEKRRAAYEKLRAGQAAKAQQVVDRVENQPGPRPGGPGSPGTNPARPGSPAVVPGGPRAPGTTPGGPGGPGAQGVNPGVPGAPGGPNNGPGDRARPGTPPGAVQDGAGGPGPVPGPRPAEAPPGAAPQPQQGEAQRRQQERRQQQEAETKRKQEAQQEQQRARQQQQQDRERQREAERQQNQQKRDAQQEQQRVRQQERQQKQQQTEQQRRERQEAQKEQQRARQQQVQQRQQGAQQPPGVGGPQRPPQAAPALARPMPGQPQRPPQGQPRPQGGAPGGGPGGPGGGAGGPGGGKPPGQPPMVPGAQ